MALGYAKRTVQDSLSRLKAKKEIGHFDGSGVECGAAAKGAYVHKLATFRPLPKKEGWHAEPKKDPLPEARVDMTQGDQIAQAREEIAQELPPRRITGVDVDELARYREDLNNTMESARSLVGELREATLEAHRLVSILVEERVRSDAWRRRVKELVKALAND